MTLNFTQGHRVVCEQSRICAFILLESGIKKPVCLQWFIMQKRWLQRSPVSMGNMDHLSVCSSCLLIVMLSSKVLSGLYRLVLFTESSQVKSIKTF